MSNKKDCDKLIKALEGFLAIAPSGAMLRIYVGDKLNDAPMPPEEFVAFSRVLLDVARKIRKKYD